MALNKTDKSFKTLINKRFTTPDRNFFQEIGTDTINTHMREVWMNVIPEDSASAIAQDYAEYYEQWILTSDPTYDDQTFYFISGSGFVPGTDDINSGWLVNAASQSYFLGDFISDKYGSDYEVKLYDNNDNQIFKTDAINWIFDYKTGVLHIADPGAYSTPYKVTVYKYTGLTLADPGAIPSGSISGSLSHWTGSFADGHIERLGNVKVSGSMYYRQGDKIYFGDGDTYIYEASDDHLNIIFPGGTIELSANQICFAGFNTPALGNATATSTVPNIVPRIGDVNTGIGHAAEDILSLIAGGVNILNVVEVSNTGSVGIGTTSPVSLVGPGGLHVWNNISASNLYWEDTDLTSFSSSVAQQIVNIETGSAIWSLESDNSISRNSNVRITGSLYTSENITSLSASIGSADAGIFLINSSNVAYASRISTPLNQFGLDVLQSGNIFSPATVNRPSLRAFRDNSYGDVSSYTAPVFMIRNQDDTSASDNIIIQSGDSPVTRFLIDYYGNTHVSGNISLSTGSTVDGVDISEFSSSVAQQIVNIETGSAIWSLKGDNSISRNSDVRITGSLFISESKWSDAIVLLDTQFIKLGDDWKFSSNDANNEFYIEYDKVGTNIGTFGLQPGVKDKIIFNLYSGSVEINTQGLPTATTNGIVLTAYGQSLLYGNVDVRSNILMQGGKTVDGVDISEFSSSVAQQIVNIETGSAIWSLKGDNSISRNSDVRVTGSLDVSNTITVSSGTIGSTIGDVAIFNTSLGYIMRVGAVTDKQVGDFLQNTSLVYTPSTITKSTLRAFRYNVNGDVTNYTQPVYVIRNQDDTSLSDNFIIESGDSSVITRLSVDYYGNMFVSGNITLPVGKTVDGVDIDVFSSSVAQQIVNIETGSSIWSLEDDNSISRNSVVRMTGSVFINSSTYPALTIRELATNYYLQFYVDSPNVAGIVFNDGAGQPAIEDNANAFSFYGGSAGKEIRIYGDTSNIKIGNVSSNKIEMTGSVEMTGSIDVTGTGSFSYISMSGDIALDDSRTVDGVDISEFSSSVAQQIVNIETGSAIWSLEGDNSISRNSDVRITGSTYIESGTGTGLEIVRGDTFNNKFDFVIGTGAAELDLYDGNGNYFGILAQNSVHNLYSQNILLIHSDQVLRIGDNSSHVTQITGSVDIANSASFQDYVEVNGFMHVDGGTW